MKPHKLTGLPRAFQALRNSIAGLRDIWRSEEAFRVESILFLASLPVAFAIGDNISQVGLMIGSILILLIVEVINTAIETVVDRIGSETHELSRMAKDLGSAAVLLSSLIPIFIWGAVTLNLLGLIQL